MGTVTAPSSAETSIEQAIGHVEAEPTIWVRVAATQGQGEAGLKQTMLDLVSGPPPPNWEPLYWRYPSAIFIASEQSGLVVARWLRERLIRLYGALIDLPNMFEPIRWDRRDSLAIWGAYVPLPWPTVNVMFNQQARGQDNASGVLVADGPPSFATYYAAASYLFNTAQPIGGGRGIAAPMYRHQDTFARINRVQIVEHSEIVRVEVEGSHLEGLVVELGGDVPGPVMPLEDGPRQSVDFPIPNGLPRDPWVLVRNGGRWLDRRFLSGQYPRVNEPGVEFVVEPTTRLQALVAAREGPEVDFKEEIPPDRDKDILRVAKTVSAFANETGGVLLFGVNDDEEIVGISSHGLDTTKNRLTSLMSTWVDPRPTITFEEFPIEGAPTRMVLGMRVERGDDVPYGAAKPGDTPRFYIRNHSQSVPARPREVQRIVQSRNPPEQGNPFGTL
jgi:hypothetical protein